MKTTKTVKYCCILFASGLLFFCQPLGAVTLSGDLNGNGVIDQEDILRLVEQLKANDLGGDIRADGALNTQDLFDFGQQWGKMTVDEDANVILGIQDRSVPSLQKALIGDLAVSAAYQGITDATMISHAFITFATATMKQMHGPPFVIFSATEGDPARRIDLTELSDLGQVLGGISFPPGRVNWIRLYILQGYPYTYIVGADESIYQLKVPSGVFRLISPGNKIIVEPDVLNMMLIDLDVSRSIVPVSGTNSILKPVVKLYVSTDEVDDATYDFH